MKLHLLTAPVMVIACAMSTLLANPALAATIDLRQLTFHAAPLSAITPSDATATPSPDNALPIELDQTPVNPVLSATEAASQKPGPTAAMTASADSITRYLTTIEQLEHNAGPYELALSEHYQGLANAYLQGGDMAAALSSLEKALQIQRINNGLFDLEQTPILRTMINTYVQLGDIPNAHRLQEALFNLQLKLYGADSIALVPAQLQWADWNVNLSLYDSSDLVSQSTSSSTINYANASLQEAYSRYLGVLEILHAQTNASDARLVATERKLAALNFMVNQQLHGKLAGGPLGSSSSQNHAQANQALDQLTTFHFVNGSSALKRAVAYGYIAAEPDYDYIAARMLELADWYLLFDRRGAALDTYQEALQVLHSINLPQDEIDRMVASGMPVLTPDIITQPEPSPQEYSGFIDVAFTLNKYGTASNPKVIADTEAEPQVIEALIRTIRSSKFRPKFTADNALNDQTVKLRYYYKLGNSPSQQLVAL